MFTSVTKKTVGKGSIIYLGLTVFLLLFSFIYEQFSYGESSLYMRGTFLVTLFGAVIFFLTGVFGKGLRNRLSLLLFNSALAVFVSGGLLKGIIDISGRSTTFDQPYWLVGLILIGLSFLVGMV